MSSSFAVRGAQSLKLPRLLDWKQALRNLKPGEDYSFNVDLDGKLSALAFGRGGVSASVLRTDNGYELELRGKAGGGAFATLPLQMNGKALGKGEVRVRAHLDELSATEAAVGKFFKEAPRMLKQARKTGELEPTANLLTESGLDQATVTTWEVGVGGEAETRLRKNLGNALETLPNLPNMPPLPRIPGNAMAQAELDADTVLMLVRHPGSNDAPELAFRAGVTLDADAFLRKSRLPWGGPRSEADLVGRLEYERRFPVPASELTGLKGASLNEALPALFQKTIATQAVKDGPVVETLKLNLAHAANDQGARTSLLVRSGPGGFDRAALQAALKARSLSELLDVLPKLGEDATVDGVMVQQAQKDFEMRPRFWLLEADLDASMNKPATPPLWKFSGKVGDPQTKPALEQAKAVLGQEIKTEVDDFVSFGESRRPDVAI
jgi:hypothetical protein